MAVRSTPVVLGNARFTVHSDGCVRMEYAQDAKFSPYPSLIVGSRTARSVKADVKVSGKTLRITTSKFELSYRDNGHCFSPENLKIVHQSAWAQREVWVPGKRDDGNLGSVRRCLDQWNWCGGPDHQPVEGILSTRGGHFLQDDARVYWNKKYDWPQHLGHVVEFDGYYFAYGKDYKSALQDYVNVFGKIPMVPRWTFGFWYSRWYAYTDKQILQLAKRYRKENIPIDVMIIDTDWRDGWGGYDWSKKYFPKPEKTIKELQGMGLRVSLNDHPGYDKYDSLPDGDSHIPEVAKRLGPLPHQGEWACDWSRKDHVKTWRDIVLGPFHDQGMDFWWIDGWIKSPFAESNSQLWANRQYYELCEEKTRKRGMILARWGGVGSHRYPVQFSGDTATEWGVLQHQIEFTARSAGLGAVYWSHDIGGFFGRKIDEEIYIRWFQFGAMSPVFRTHSDHGIREPWKFSKKAKDLFRKQTHIRYAMVPYLYGLSKEAHDTGMPLIRPLFLEYNDGDGGALNRKHQYTIGRDLLIIPADGPREKGAKNFTKRAYFPPGVWYGLETNEIINGTEDRTIDIPLELIPTYVRRGAIIPCQPVQDAVGTAPPDEIHFEYYPDPLADSAYDLYEDDGESMDAAKGRSATIRVQGKKKAEYVDVSIHAPRGSYKGMPRKRTYVVRVRLDAAEKISAVEAKVGSGARKQVAHKTTKTCLAGTVKSGHTFCEATVESGNKPVRIRFKLAS